MARGFLVGVCKALVAIAMAPMKRIQTRSARGGTLARGDVSGTTRKKKTPTTRKKTPATRKKTPATRKKTPRATAKKSSKRGGGSTSVRQAKKKQKKTEVDDPAEDCSALFHAALGEGSGLIREKVLGYMQEKRDKAFCIWSLLMLGTIDRETAKREFGHHLGMMVAEREGQEKPMGKRMRAELKRLSTDLVVSKAEASRYIPAEAMEMIRRCMVVCQRKKQLAAIVGQEAVDTISMEDCLETYSHVDMDSLLVALVSDPNRRCTEALARELDLKVSANISLMEALKGAVRKHGSWSGLLANMEAKARKREARAQKRMERESARYHARYSELEEAFRARNPMYRDNSLRDDLTVIEEYLEQSSADPQTARRIANRYSQLEEAFRPRNLTIRSDSRLIKEFLDWGSSGNPNRAREIARIMDEMRFYHGHTSYRECYREVMEEERAYYRRWGEPWGERPWFDREDLDGFSASAKVIALERWVRSNLNNLDAAMQVPEFPPSLRSKAREIQRRFTQRRERR